MQSDRFFKTGWNSPRIAPIHAFFQSQLATLVPHCVRQEHLQKLHGFVFFMQNWSGDSRRFLSSRPAEMGDHQLILFLIALSIMISLAESDTPPVFRPVDAIPDEFFTCAHRTAGLYADDKRSCVFYWNCSSDGSVSHVRCPPSTPVFDDESGRCVKGDKCPLDYGYFQSASSFCRGRPIGSSWRTSAQAFYANTLNNCDSYFWCSLSDGQWHGQEMKCSNGEKFDENSSACKNSKSVTCKISHGADIV